MSGFIPVHTYIAAEILAAETCTIHSLCVCVCVCVCVRSFSACLMPRDRGPQHQHH